MPHHSRNINAVNTVKCAGPGCHKTRGSTDSWFITVIEHEVFSCRRYEPLLPLRRSEQPICGQACAVRLFDRFLSNAKAASCSTDPSLIVKQSKASTAVSAQHRGVAAR